MIKGIPYVSPRWVWPPRPNAAVPCAQLPNWTKANHIAQAKLNGSCTLVFTNGHEVKVMNRHQEYLTNVKLVEANLRQLHRGKDWTVLVGEYLNKSQKLNTHNNYNTSFVVFDLLAYNGQLLVGYTLRERLALLNILYPSQAVEHPWFRQIMVNDRPLEQMMLISTFENKFTDLWNQAQNQDLIEGLVVKKTDATLVNPVNDSANAGWQWKFRKPTKNYSF